MLEKRRVRNRKTGMT